MDVPIVFLSHSTRDRDLAVALKEILATHTKGEIEWWLSSDGQSIRGGKNWRAEVEKALRECKLLFILFSSASQQSAWVHFEAGFAEALGKEIVPIALPGFDLDVIPGPLQHKQGFNLRGASGLNNILSLTNQVLKRHDLLTLTDDHYEKVFGNSSNRGETLQLLDAYLKTIELSADAAGPILETIAAQARQIVGADPAVQTMDHKQVVAGPGFILREVVRNALATKMPGSESVLPLYELQGELTASGLVELLPVFASEAVSRLLPTGGSFECTLRKGIKVLTNQARILANMRGTSMRFTEPSVCSFGTISFAPRTYDANARRGIFVRSLLRVEATPPEPYVPKDLRYQFLLQWDSPCPSEAMKEMLDLLIERHVIFIGQDGGAD